MANFTTVSIFTMSGENGYFHHKRENSHFPVSKQMVKVQLPLDMLENSMLCAQAHNAGVCVTSDNVRRRSKPRRSRGIVDAQTRQSRDEPVARSVLRALSRVSQCSELCALAHILFYVTVVRIRVFMRKLESNLVLIVVVCCASCTKRAQIGDQSRPL